MEISLAAEKLFQIGKYPITNSLLTCWLVMIFLIVVSFIVRKRIKDVPSGFVNFIEWVIEALFDLFDSVTQERKLTKRFFPIVCTIFLLVLVSNWSEILPGVGSIGIKHKKEAIESENKESTKAKVLIWLKEARAETVKNDIKKSNNNTAKNEKGEAEEQDKKESSIIPFFRAPSSDLNFTLGLAIISVISTQIFGIFGAGFFKYIKKFLNFRGPIDFFVGILESISEFAKLISFSLRLFGNIFAGEVLLMVIAFLIPIIVPIPFYFLEIFIGLIQAFIFSMLTLVFLTMAVKTVEH